ncbi:hypothetical protein ACEWY4_025076 [Coilia grayii]|uniref:Ubiquitin-like domain-containing protein n=1 Tax=Coilia grayii TaxID=363190 RepID=A0ABD1IWW1_9TELE
MSKTYQVVVDGVEGRKRTVDVANTEEDFNNTTVLEVKKKLSEKMPGNTDPSELRFIYTTKQLEDTGKLSDYGIKPGSLLMAVLRLHGGHDSFTLPHGRIITSLSPVILKPKNALWL